MKWCAISDIHGQMDALSRLESFVLKRNPQVKFIYLGDFVDRGPDSASVLTHVQKQVAAGHVAVIGNHELFLMEYLKGEFYEYANQFGFETIRSLDPDYTPAYDTRSLQEQRQRIVKAYPQLLDFLESLPHIYEDKDTVFIHGGFNPHLDDFRQSSENELTCPPYKMPMFAGLHPFKQFVFGHVPASEYHQDDTKLPYKIKNFTFIDGGAGYGQQLNAYFDSGFSVCSLINPS